MSELTPKKALDNLNEAWRGVAFQGTLSGAKKLIDACEKSVETLRTFIDEHTTTADAPADAAPAVDEGGE